MKTKLIVINGEQDYNNFLKKLKFYKTFLYRRTFFTVENNKKKPYVEDVAYALNIKKRRERIKYIYDQSCKIIDDQVGNKNICGFKKGQCYKQRGTHLCNGCCRKCRYQTCHGCSTKNLACKMFNCSEVRKRFNVITFDDLKLLKLLSFKNRIVVKSDFFSQREDVLKDLYAYTLTYSGIRIIYRLGRNGIYLHIHNKKMYSINKLKGVNINDSRNICETSK